MTYRVGDIIRNRFAPEITGLIFGFGVGSRFDRKFHFRPDATIWLAVNEDGIIYPIQEDNADYDIVDHIDFKSIRDRIEKARTA